MNDTIDRKRSVDVSNLSPEQVDALSDQIGNKIRELVDTTCEKANKILKVYGLEAKMQIVILEKNNQPQ